MVPALHRSRHSALIEIRIERFRNLIAIAGCRFKILAIEDPHSAPLIFDQATALQCACNQGNGRAPRAQHHSEELLREVQNVGLGSILGHQQPSGEPFFMLVEPIASGKLAKAHGLLLHKLQHAIADLFVLPKGTQQLPERHSQSRRSQLDETIRRYIRGSEEMKASNQAFASDETDLSGPAVLHHGHDGRQAGGHEVGIGRHGVRFVQGFPERKIDLNAKLDERFPAAGRQRIEEAIGVMRGHDVSFGFSSQRRPQYRAAAITSLIETGDSFSTDEMTILSERKKKCRTEDTKMFDNEQTRAFASAYGESLVCLSHTGSDKGKHTMPLPACVLVYGRDPQLGGTRSLILKRAGYQVWTALHLAEVIELTSVPRMDVLLLCYTLSPKDCACALALARGRWPQIQSIALVSTSPDCLAADADAVLNVMDGPVRLIQAVNDCFLQQPFARANDTQHIEHIDEETVAKIEHPDSDVAEKPIPMEVAEKQAPGVFTGRLD
jgi:hypothetical protein